MSSLEILVCLRQLLNKPANWTKGTMARGSDGRRVKINHIHACAFSLEGGLYRLALVTNTRIQPVHELLKGLIHPRKVVSLDTYNNSEGLTHQSLLNLLDRAILTLGGQPPVRDLGDDE